MKKFALLIMILVIVKSQAQNYQVSFAGTGASSTVDSVKVQNLTQCTSLLLDGGDTLHLSATVGINELNTGTDNFIHIYPNPMTDFCLINFEATEDGNTTISLYDIAGKRITQVQEFLAKGQHTYKLSGTGSGIYVLKVETLHATSLQYSYTAKIISCNQTSGIAEIKHIEAAPNVNKESTASNIKTIKGLKNYQIIKDMNYHIGDILKLTGISGIYRTVFMLIPTQSQLVTFNFVACSDVDNNNYTVVEIGAQTWMEENLKTTKYNDGTPIPLVTDTNTWINLTTPAYCWDNNDIGYKDIYGGLYNWYAVNTGNLCPTGWHVLTSSDWTTLTTNLGGSSMAGGALKEDCSSNWANPNTGATNSSGFTALPAGNRRFSDGLFYSMGSISLFWSSSANGTLGEYDYQLDDIDTKANTNTTYGQGALSNGFSVRCVK